jgi:hypothetical protein
LTIWHNVGMSKFELPNGMLSKRQNVELVKTTKCRTTKCRPDILSNL